MRLLQTYHGAHAKCAQRQFTVNVIAKSNRAVRQGVLSKASAISTPSAMNLATALWAVGVQLV